MLKVQIIAAVIMLIGLCLIINMIRKKRLELKYALSWLTVIVILLVLDLFPLVLNYISYVFGIATPVNTLFVLGFCFSLIIIFVLTVAVSRLSEKVRQLAQAVALNEKKIMDLEEERNRV